MKPVEIQQSVSGGSALYPPAPTGWLATGPVSAVVRRLLVRAAAMSGITVSEAGDGKEKDADLVLLRPDAFYARVGTRGLIGFGESYTAGDWEARDLAGTLTALCRKITTLIPAWMQKFRGVYLRRRPGSQKNTVAGAKVNISHHYDLSNDFFATFLDEGMSYSSALFGGEAGTDKTLREAQNDKIDRALDRAGVTDGSSVLEIGTGWGELSIRAARRGAHVHSVTLSTEQADLARERIGKEGLSDLVDVEIRDYREVTGEYDAVVSIEMIEAVGYEYWDQYMADVSARLRPGGRAVIQAITMDHNRMLETRDGASWITTYIFPGGCIPSVRALDDSAVRAGMTVGHRLSFGRDYAETLSRWDDAFRSATDRVDALGFGPDFRRLWHFYLCYCEAGFAAGYIDVGQLEYRRAEGAGE